MPDEHLAAIMAVLEQVEPYQPRAVSLLLEQRERTGHLWPVLENRVELVRATIELRDYADSVHSLEESFEKLSPVPLHVSTPDIEAYSL